jgi:hypothetical protein
MTDSSDPKHDELRDRLADFALRELLGRETPPCCPPRHSGVFRASSRH